METTYTLHATGRKVAPGKVTAHAAAKPDQECQLICSALRGAGDRWRKGDQRATRCKPRPSRPELRRFAGSARHSPRRNRCARLN